MFLFFLDYHKLKQVVLNSTNVEYSKRDFCYLRDYILRAYRMVIFFYFFVTISSHATFNSSQVLS